MVTIKKEIKELGRGTFGTVDLVEGIDNKLYVVKTMKYRNSKGKNRIQKEIEIIKYLKPICRDYFLCFDSAQHYSWQKKYKLITKYIENSYTLGSYIHNNNLLLLEKLFIMKDLVIGLSIMHAAHVVHRDIKANNILYLPKRGLRCKYIDYGLACINTDKVDIEISSPCDRGTVGTSFYIAPEIVRNDITTFEQLYATDMWSLGILFYYIAFDQFPITSSTIQNLLYKIGSLNKNIVPWNNREILLQQGVSKRDISIFGPIITFMLKINPSARKTARELIRYINTTIRYVISNRRQYKGEYRSEEKIKDDLMHEIKINPNTKFMISTQDSRYKTIEILSRPQEIINLGSEEQKESQILPAQFQEFISTEVIEEE